MMRKKVPVSRIISGTLLILALAVGVYLGGWFLTIGMAILPFFFVYDAIKVLKSAGKSVFSPILYLNTALLLPAYQLAGLEGTILLFMSMIVLTFVWVLIDKRHRFEAVIYTFFVMLYPLMPAAAMVYLTQSGDRIVTGIFVVMACLFPSMADMGGYFSGMLWGKKKLCPEISPHKTIAGSVGAFLWSAAFGALSGWLMTAFVYDGIAFIHYLLIGILCGVFAQVGDLSASMLKRYCGVKDFGTYIPGQGGAMDRFDSILVCSAIVFIYLRLLLL